MRLFEWWVWLDPLSQTARDAIVPLRWTWSLWLGYGVLHTTEEHGSKGE